MRRRLLLVAFATSTLVVAAFALPLATLVQTVAHDRAVTAAERDAAALAPVLAITTDRQLVEIAVARTETGAQGRLAVSPEAGEQIGDQTEVSAEATSLVRTRQIAFTQQSGGGREIYVPVVTGDGNVSVIRARVPDEVLNRGVARAWTALGAVAVALIAASVVVADRLSLRLTREARSLATTAQHLASGTTNARVPQAATPELDEAGGALNQLADRIDELRAAERERVADLSHRLRTPLTGLRLDAEHSADQQLVDGVDRLEAAISELINSARRPLHDHNVRATCDAVVVVRERSDFWSALAADDNRGWSAELSEDLCVVHLQAADLAATLDALVANVFTHTESGVGYQLSVTREADEVVIAVEDEGPGLRDSDLARRGETGGSSTGLGLDIAASTAGVAGGRLLTLDAALGGLRVELRLPVVEAA